MAEIRWTDEQRQAIDHRDGPLRIIAGAGSGKTATMTAHIVEMIRSRYVQPDQIVALTFTNAAADELTDRIRQSLNDPGVSVWSGTYHSFGMQVVRDGALSLGLPANPRLFSPAESWLIIRDILRDGIELEHLDISYGLTRAVNGARDFISRCKDELVFPEQVASYLASLPEEDGAHRAEIGDYHRLYAEYQQRCRALGGIDFGDQIALAVRALQQDESLLADYRERYRVFVVDEYQDTNYAQSVFVQLLSSPDHQIRIVGDPNQSIYRFRGAAVDNIERFSEEIEGVVDVSLTTNFRSHQRILDLANELVRSDGLRSLALNAHGGRTGPVPVVASGESVTDEVTWIAETLGQHYDEASSDDEMPGIAVLVRKRKLLPDIASALEDAGLPYEVYGDRTIFDSESAQDVIATLQLLTHPRDHLSLVRALRSPRYGMHHRSIYRLRRLLDKDDILGSLARIADEPPGDMDEDSVAAVERFCRDLRQIHARTNALPLDVIVREIGSIHAGNLSQFDVQAIHHLERLAAGFAENVIDASLGAFTDYIDAIKDLGAGEAVVDMPVDGDAIALMTVHGAKGLEFDVVVIAGANKNDFGGNASSSLPAIPAALLHNAAVYPSRDEFEDRDEYEKAVKEIEKRLNGEEERRLFYVAITRAREHLYFAWSKTHPTRKRETTIYPLLAGILDLTEKIQMPLSERGQKPAPVMTFFEQTGVQLDPRDDFQSFRAAWQDYWHGSPLEEQAMQALNEGFERFQAERPEREEMVARLRNIRRTRPYQPLPPDLYSYSLIDTYERCPRLYLYRYVLGIPSPPVEASYTDLGRRFHEALHQEHLNPSSDPGEDFTRYFDASSNGRGAGTNGYESIARTVLEKYLESDDVKAEALAVEPEFFLRFDSGPDSPIIYGLIDRIQHRPGGEIEIVDYKTHRDLKTRDEVLEDLQLPIYIMAAREALGYNPTYATMAFVRHGVWHRFHIHEFDLAAARARIEAAITGILTHHYACRCDGALCAPWE